MNIFRIGTRRDPEVVLQLSLIPVVDEIDTRINLRVAHAAELGHIAPPLSRIVSDQIIAFSGERIRTHQLSVRASTRQFHPQHGCVRIF